MSKNKNQFYFIFLFFLSNILFSTLLLSKTSSQPTIALIEYNADTPERFAQKNLNLKNLTQLVNSAISANSKIIVLPEGAIAGYQKKEGDITIAWGISEDMFYQQQANERASRLDKYTFRSVGFVAEEIPMGKTTKYWEKIAIDNNVYILFNMPEISGYGNYYNTTAVVGPDGYVGKYRKNDLFFVDMLYAESGTDPFILETPYGTFGILICLDVLDRNHVHFPYFRQQGIDNVILPTNWAENPKDESWGAKYYFPKRTTKEQVNLFIADSPLWEGTGKYLKDGSIDKCNSQKLVGVGSVYICNL